MLRSALKLPPGSAKTVRWKILWFLKLTAGIWPCFSGYWSSHPFVSLPVKLCCPSLFSPPSFFLMVGNEGEPSYSAQECQGCDIHCEVLKVTVHSWTCIFKNLAELQTGRHGTCFNVSNFTAEWTGVGKFLFLLNICLHMCWPLHLSVTFEGSLRIRAFIFLSFYTDLSCNGHLQFSGGEKYSPALCASLRQKHQWINPAISVGHSGRFCYLSKSRAGPQAKARQRPCMQGRREKKN